MADEDQAELYITTTYGKSKARPDGLDFEAQQALLEAVRTEYREKANVGLGKVELADIKRTTDAIYKDMRDQDRSNREAKSHYSSDEIATYDLVRAIRKEPKVLAARGALIKKVGEAKANELATSMLGLKNIADFKTPPANLAPKSLRKAAKAARKEAAGVITNQPINGNRKAYTGPNPWSREHWSVTKQGEVVKAIGLDGARAMAAKSQSYLGATKPTA